MSRVHVVPQNDWVGHEQSDDCVCGPDTEFVAGGAIIVHHVLDNRLDLPPSVLEASLADLRAYFEAKEAQA